MADIVAADERVLKDPAPLIAPDRTGRQQREFRGPPLGSRANDYWAVHFDLTEKIKKAFDAEGITIPYPPAGCACLRAQSLMAGLGRCHVHAVRIKFRVLLFAKPYPLSEPIYLKGRHHAKKIAYPRSGPHGPGPRGRLRHGPAPGPPMSRCTMQPPAPTCPKWDNFLVILDASYSMSETYMGQKETGPGRRYRQPDEPDHPTA